MFVKNTLNKHLTFRKAMIYQMSLTSDTMQAIYVIVRNMPKK